MTSSTFKMKGDQTSYAFAFLKNASDVSVAPVGGVSFLLSSPRLNERFGFLLEAQYTKASYYLYREVTSGSTTERFYSSIHLSQIHIPVAVRYTFVGKKLTPFIEVGMSVSFAPDPQSEMKREMEIAKIVQTSPDVSLPIRKQQFGFWGGGGVEFSVHRRLTGFAEFRYEQTNGLFVKDQPFDDLSSAVTSLQLIIGLRTK